MIKSASIPVSAAALAVLPAAQAPAAPAVGPAGPAVESSDYGRWYISPAFGFWNFEGDEPLEDGFYGSLRVGYDYSEWWMFEVNAIFAPSLDENLSGYYWDGKMQKVRESKSKGDDKYFDHTWGLQLYGDAMLHFTSWERLDPYVIFGIGLETFGKNVMEDAVSLNTRVGGGVMYHLDDSWTLRADTRVNLAGYNTEFNHTIDVGFIYRFGAERIKDDPPPAVALDSDGDGLLDDDEIRLGTDPNNPDTDGDGLLDGEEIKAYGTNPLNPDTDGDGLTDGEEVRKYKTNPLNPDTDGDGLLDGDEVKKFGTDPRNPDTDGDGLKDGEEVVKFGTNPLDPDTDNDGLKDGDEVKKFGTNPLNPDSDYDMLSDGAEVLQYRTNPLDPDTDKGGVRDGHEVIYDRTDPLVAADDILFFELKINFDTDKSVIKPQYFGQLDKVAKVMLENPGSTATVEGHADRRATSQRAHNLRLSESRAKAICSYLQGKGIDGSRLKAIGYGFDHPKAPNDAKEGNLENRRVEVYIEGVKTGKVNYVNPGR